MEITLNGEKRKFPKTLTVAELLKDLGLDPKTVLVELNLQVVPRDKTEGVTIRDGDSVEIVSIFGGG